MIEAKLISRVKPIAFVTVIATLLTGCGSGIIADVPGSVRPAKSQFSGTYPQDFPLHGIDVSKYQGEIDWDRVRRGGISFAYIKATEGGNHLDPRFQANWEGARAAGIPRGAYHFVWWCRSPLEEISWFEQNVPVERDALPPVLDVEATPTSRTCKRHLQRDEVLQEMRMMLAEMERHYGKRPVIYTTVDFYEAILQPNELSEYPIWIRSTKYSPHVKYGSRNWKFWQYQSDGVVPGVRTNVDRNAFHGDAKEWLAFASGWSVGQPQSIQVARPEPVRPEPARPEPMAAPEPVIASAREPVTASIGSAPLALLPPARIAEDLPLR